MKTLMLTGVQKRIAVGLVALAALIITFGIRQAVAGMVMTNLMCDGRSIANVKSGVINNFADIIRTNVVYEESAGRNPIQKPRKIAVIEREEKFPSAGRGSGNKPVSGVAFVLQGIMYSGDRRIAVISGQTVEEGEEVGSARVVHIGKDGVTLVQDGIEIKLSR
ncbi:MAG: hypothetical protein ABH885_02735 [Candidatus Omnitrophota bacterium]